MNLLGSVGQLYMFVLLMLLFLGSGLAIWRFINFLMDRTALKKGMEVNKKQDGYKITIQDNYEIKQGKGGNLMANNGWVKLAVFSLVGIIVSVAILGFVSSSSTSIQGMNMGTMNQNSMQQQMGTNMQGSMNMNTQMGNMQAQGSMNMNGNMNQNQMIQQQLNQLQQQLNQIQQQMGSMNGSMNGNSQMQQNSTGSMSGSGNMGGMGMGMMSGMMGMGNMQQSGNMNNMQQSSGNSNMQSSGGMGMM